MSTTDTDTEDDPTRAFAKALFADPDILPVPDPVEQPAGGNVAPKEGGNQPTQSGDQVMRAFAKALFADPDILPVPDPVEQPAGGNVVPREGNNPKPSTNNDMREFTRALFDTDEN